MGHLKSFTIQGFKTFPDRLTLEIQDGITAVVGPNGSGKSNIGEAVRWVLGEQNARVMRCERKMEEIIFHGTAQRSALGFAEVSLTLNNQIGRFGIDSEEIVITRRLYRSGESEYYINKAGVRLKDVLNLLMDTGLGAGGYSIIGQGMIDRIMSEKPIDRRRVFEEAAGIAKYRSRKDEASRKLLAAEQNLQRVGDKIDELRPQAESLREQAETAKRYLLLRDELRGHEINIWMHELDKLRSGRDKLNSEYKEAREACRAGQAALEALSGEAGQMEALAISLAQQAEERRRERESLEERRFEAERDLTLARNNIKHNEESLAALQLAREQAEGQETLLREQEKEESIRLREIIAGIALSEAELSGIAAKASALAEGSGDISSRIDALRAQQGIARAALGEARLRESAGKGQKLEWSARREALSTEQKAQEQSLLDAKNACETSQKSLADAENRRDEIDNVLSGYTLRVNSRQKKLDDCKTRNELLRRKLHETESRHTLLSDIEKEYEGNHAVQMVMKSDLRGLRGTVGELITVSDELAVAIEIALGSAMSNIVVNTEEDARAAIRFLKDRRGGRATFLPLSAVNGIEMGELPDSGEIVGIASRLLECDERYHGIVRHLLGRTVITRTLDGAIALSKKEKHRLRIVTLDGQVINAGGAMTGGSIGKKIGILTRKNEILRLETELLALRTEWQESEQMLQESERGMKAAEYDLEVAQSEQRAVLEELAALRTEVEHKGVWLRNLETNRTMLENELSELIERLRERSNEEQILFEEIMNHEALIAELEKEIETLSGDSDSLQEKREGLFAEQSAQRERLAGLNAERSAKENLLRDYAERLQNLSGGEDDRIAKRERCESENKLLSEQIAQRQAQLELLSGKSEAIRLELEDSSARQMDLERRRTQNNREQNSAFEQNLALTRAADKLENSLVSGQKEEDDLIGKLWDQYELSVSGAQALRTEMESVAKTGRRIAELNKEIRSLGDINIKAIEDYEKIGERFEYLTTQREDALHGKEELDAVIADIMGEMRTIFSHQFALINAHFAQTFSDIFGGGEATLELDEDTDILESGVEIKAQPPGKKLRSISLLSGGEQSLTAIALYFAMFRVRPSPFCVLDEIDHDLDDVNVSRFAAYLKKFSAETQFIVITHRRGTMEQSNMLYGVTAQEPGVSKVLSLRLEDVDESIGD